MSFTDDQLAHLRAPLARDAVKEREQGGRKVSYIEGWHAIAEANRIFGFDAWDRETVECRLIAERETTIGRAPQQKPGWRVYYIAKVRVTVRPTEKFTNPVVREGTGYGSGIDSDLGAAHESAIKEAETDAMKRALMTFGNPFGLALYDKMMAEVEPIHRPPLRPAPTAKAEPVRAVTDPSAEAAKAQARADYVRIQRDLKAARLPAIVDQIIEQNGKALQAIKSFDNDAYEGLMSLANGRKASMLSAA